MDHSTCAPEVRGQVARQVAWAASQAGQVEEIQLAASDWPMHCSLCLSCSSSFFFHLGSCKDLWLPIIEEFKLEKAGRESKSKWM